MVYGRWLILTVAFVVVFAGLAGPGVATAQWGPIFSTFDDDTVGLPPALGGSNQPSVIINGGVLVEASANGIATQPLVIDDDFCDPTYFGGVYYNLPTPVTSGTLRVEATVAFNQLTDSVFFDTAVSTQVTSATRLYIEPGGTIVDAFDVVIDSYSPDTPIRFRADIDMDTKTWACTIDNDLDGFANDQVVSGLQFVNAPGIIPQIGSALFALYAGSAACADSRVVAYDDILIATGSPIFIDGFETGGFIDWIVFP